MPEINGDQPTHTILTLVRHGETDWNLEGRYQGHVDIPLNARGVKQAQLLADRLEGTQWGAILSSPSSRAYDVARRIAEAIGYPVDSIERRDDLMERAYGEAEGMTKAERAAAFDDPDAVPGLEPLEQVESRILNAMASIAREHLNERVLVVCHGTLINCVAHHFAGGTLEATTPPAANVSLTTVSVTDNRWNLESFGDAAHLDGTEFEPTPLKSGSVKLLWEQHADDPRLE